jgi:hypothetical protein
MKKILIIFVFAFSLSCKGDTKENTSKKITVKTVKPVIINPIKPVIINDPIITSITFTSGEIIGDNHYGFEYDFTINIDNSNNLDILSFCKANLYTILNNRVADVQVIQSIIDELNNGEINIDKDPKGLRLVTSTEYFDAVGVEIYLKENNLVKMNLKYYSPL